MRVSSPPKSCRASSSTASLSSVTALATRRPNGFSALRLAAITASDTPPPMKTASGAGRSASASGALPSTISNFGAPSARAFGGDRPPVGTRFDADGPRLGRGTHPFDADRTAARADVPQQRVAQRHEPGERQRPDGLFRHPAVGPERFVGQTGARQDLRVLPADAFDRQQVEIGNFGIPAIGNAIETLFVRSAESGQDGHSRGTISALRKHLRDDARRGPVPGQHQQAGSGMKIWNDLLGCPAMGRQRLDIGKRPAKPAGRPLEGRKLGMEMDFFGRDRLGDPRSDRIPKRVTGNENDDPAALVAPDAVDHRVERGRPG